MNISQMAQSARPPTATGANKWWILIAISLALFMSAANGTMVNLALPTLLQQFEASFAVVQWVVLAYLISTAVVLPSVGRWADLMGRRKVFMQGQLLFIVGATLCAFAPNIYWLIGVRIVQAFGSAMMMGIGIAIITETWPRAQRGKALGIASGCIASGAVAGPLIGGLLLEVLSWRWLFFINVPLGLFALIVVWRIVPSLAPAGADQRFDLKGAVTIGGALLCLSLALTLGQRVGYASPWILALALATALFAYAFVRVERSASDPMIDLTLFQDVAFSFNLISALVVFAAISGVTVVIPFYLELVLGASQRTMGLMLAVLPLAYVATTPISGILSDRVGTRPMIGLGLGLTGLSMVLAAQLTLETPIWIFVLYLIPIGLGLGGFNTPNTSAVMGRAPKAQLGVVSSLLSETRTLGQAIGVAGIGSFFAFRVQTLAGPGITMQNASDIHIVHGLRDDFLVAAFLIFLCMGGLIWAWQRSSENLIAEAGD